MESVCPLLAVLAPLVAVPLTVIMFYLRSLREHQVSWRAELVRRVESIEGAITEIRKSLGGFEREYTTKEEWLRECMHARRMLEQLTETTIRIETAMHGAPSMTSPAHQAKHRWSSRAASDGRPAVHDDLGGDEG